ncbi:hypothetical protein BaRGS_00026516, partial [Batillaria attramentaria]
MANLNLCCIRHLFTVGIFISATAGLEWAENSVDDGAQLEACLGETVTFPWQFTTSDDETVVNVEWHKTSEGIQTILAIHNDGVFFPSPATNLKLSMIQNAGLQVSNFTWTDFGTYRVTVNTLQHGVLKSSSRTAVLSLPEVAKMVLGEAVLLAVVGMFLTGHQTCSVGHGNLNLCGCIRHLFTVGIVISATAGLEWAENSVDDGAQLEACLGETVTFSWQFTTSDDETVVNVEWHKTSEGIQTILATYTDGVFFPSPATNLKLSMIQNAGLQVSNFTWTDFGTYRVTVNTLQHGVFKSSYRTAVLSLPEVAKMVRDEAVLLAIVGMFLTATAGLEWAENSVDDGAQLEACLGETVTFSWQFTTSDDETVVNVEWHKTSEGIQTILATYTDGVFFPSPATNLKLSMIQNAGLQVSNFTWTDFGKYRVTVNTLQHGVLKSSSRTAVLSLPEVAKMVRDEAVLLAIVGMFLTVSSGLEWTEKSLVDGATKEACLSDTVSFPWHFTLAEDETIVNLEWHKKSDGVETTLAMYNGQVFFKSPLTDLKLSLLPNAGLQVSNFTWTDFGTYRVTVNTQQNGVFKSNSRAAVLSPPDAPVLAGGRLVAQMVPRPITDNTTGELHVQLVCGNFVYLGTRKPLVVWKVAKMVRDEAVLLAIVGMFLTVSSGLEWTEKSLVDGANKEACLSDTVSFPWHFTLAEDETIVNVEWHRKSDGVETMLAIYNGGLFFKSPLIHLKLSLLPNAGLQVSNFSWTDFGTYRVTVKTQQHGALKTSSRSAVLSIPDAPIIAGGRLVAQMVPRSVTDNTTGELHVQLACGNFVRFGTRPPSVVWK